MMRPSPSPPSPPSALPQPWRKRSLATTACRYLAKVAMVMFVSAELPVALTELTAPEIHDLETLPAITKDTTCVDWAAWIPPRSQPAVVMQVDHIRSMRCCRCWISPGPPFPWQHSLGKRRQYEMTSSPARHSSLEQERLFQRARVHLRQRVVVAGGTQHYQPTATRIHCKPRAGATLAVVAGRV